MVKIDLITGFLGSGKTTFIQNYAHYLNSIGERICIIENDFGAINVDMMLLGNLQNDLCDVEMVIGGDIDCLHRRLKTKLISMAMLGYKRIIMEPSGIFDVDEIMDLLYESPLDNWYELGNIISIVDASLNTELSKESNYLLASQIAKAGKIILSKSQNATDKQIAHTIDHLNEVMEMFNCNRVFKDEVITLPWSEYTNKEYEMIERAEYKRVDHIKLRVLYENQYKNLFFMNLMITPEKLEEAAHQIFLDPLCGNVIRIKGFIPFEGHYKEINATKNEFSYQESDIGQNVVIMIGENLNEEAIQGYLK